MSAECVHKSGQLLVQNTRNLRAHANGAPGLASVRALQNARAGGVRSLSSVNNNDRLLLLLLPMGHFKLLLHLLAVIVRAPSVR